MNINKQEQHWCPGGWGRRLIYLLIICGVITERNSPVFPVQTQQTQPQTL